MQTDSHILGDQAVVLRVFGGLDESQAETFSVALSNALDSKPRIVVDLSEVRPLCAKALVLLLGVSKRAKGKGGGCCAIPPRWISEGTQGPKLDLSRYGFTVVGSYREGLDRFNLFTVSDELPKVAEETAEKLSGDDEGDEGESAVSIVSELSSALEFWLKRDADEEDPELNDEQLDQVAGGSQERGGIFGEIKAGMAYWLGKGKAKDS